MIYINGIRQIAIHWLIINSDGSDSEPISGILILLPLAIKRGALDFYSVFPQIESLLASQDLHFSFQLTRRSGPKLTTEPTFTSWKQLRNTMPVFHFQSPLGIVLLLLHIKGLKVLLFSGASNHFNILINKPSIVLPFLAFIRNEHSCFELRKNVPRTNFQASVPIWLFLLIWEHVGL